MRLSHLRADALQEERGNKLGNSLLYLNSSVCKTLCSFLLNVNMWESIHVIPLEQVFVHSLLTTDSSTTDNSVNHYPIHPHRGNNMSKLWSTTDLGQEGKKRKENEEEEEERIWL